MLRLPFIVVLVAAAAFVPGALSHDPHGGIDSKCPIVIKVLDAVRGIPAPNVTVKILKEDESHSWTVLSTGMTGQAGEVHDIVTEATFVEGVYKVHFETSTYWSSLGLAPFYDCADMVFSTIHRGHHHYTLALLLSPYSYSATAVVKDFQPHVQGQDHTHDHDHDHDHDHA
uniref:Transthyretin n=1 Tax=Callorhinchus milii TaxID=7868 RepID=K4GHQ7_CALMI|nr:transthyretin precursor [Callorhinchus milii]